VVYGLLDFGGYWFAKKTWFAWYFPRRWILGQAPFDDFGLPWHNHSQSELQPILQGEPVELTFDLRPTAWQFSTGIQICITVTFADAGNFDTPILHPLPTLQLLRDVNHPSFLDIPIFQYP